jgi:hypothetical protein
MPLIPINQVIPPRMKAIGEINAKAFGRSITKGG